MAPVGSGRLISFWRDSLSVAMLVGGRVAVSAPSLGPPGTLRSADAKDGVPPPPGVPSVPQGAGRAVPGVYGHEAIGHATRSHFLFVGGGGWSQFFVFFFWGGGEWFFRGSLKGGGVEWFVSVVVPHGAEKRGFRGRFL